MIPVRQSTAFETAVGPVLDADGVAVTAGLAVTDFKIKKTTGDFAALNGSATLAHVSAGVYDLVLTTSDVDTVGACVIAIDDTVNACQSLYLQVLEEAVYDAMFAASANGFAGAAGASTVTFANTSIGSVTGNVGGSLLGSVIGDVQGNIQGNVEAIGAGAITAASIVASALNGKGDWNIGKSDYALTATTGLGNQTSNITGTLSGTVGGIAGTITTLDALDTAQDSQHATTLARTPAAAAITNINTVFNTDFATNYNAATDRWIVQVAAMNNGVITNNAINTGAISAASFAAGAIDAAAIAADAGNKIADAILLRNVSNVEGTAGEHTLCTVVLAMLENTISGTTLTIKRTDGATTHATKTLTVDANADPITGIT